MSLSVLTAVMLDHILALSRTFPTSGPIIGSPPLVCPDNPRYPFPWLISLNAVIAPYAPEQNGLIERFFRSLTEECI